MTLLRQSRVLVTGAGGFLGSAVSRAAIRAGVEVHELHRRPTHRKTADTQAEYAVRTWHADLASLESVQTLIAAVAPQVIIHCAGYANAGRGLAHVDPATHDNLLATVNLLSAAAQYGGARVVISGSVETPCGNAGVDAVAPNSPYAASKLAEAFYARMFHQIYGLNVSIARMAVIYGPGEIRQAKLIPYIAGHLSRGEPAQLTSGRRRIDWLYIDDAAEGMIACAGRDDLGGQTIEVGTGRLTTVADVAAIIGRRMGRSDLIRLGAIPDRPDELEVATDADETARRLGWRAAVDLEQGLARTVDWFRSTYASSIQPAGLSAEAVTQSGIDATGGHGHDLEKAFT